MRNFLVLLICLTTLVAVAQSSPKYVPGTILDVVAIKSAPDGVTEIPVYHVSVRVKDTVYVVRYAATPGLDPAKYAAGMQLPVLVSEDTIKFNDLTGQSFEVPIVKKTPLTAPKSPK